MLYRLLERHMGAAGGDRPLLVSSEATYTSADIRRQSSKVAAWLRASGLARGDRVVIDLKNGIGAVATLFGVAQAGGVVVGGSPQWTVQQLEHVIADSGAKILVTSELRAKQLGDRRPPHVLVQDGSCEGTTTWGDLAESSGSESGSGSESDSDKNEIAACDPEEPAILIYTSGSTGKPKGVIHSHRNLEEFARIVSAYLENDANDRLLWMLGWSFGYGLSQLLTMCWVGGRVIVPASMLPADILKTHEQHGTTGLAQVPHGWEQLLNHLEKTGRQLTGLRYITNAGDGPSAALLERLPRALPNTRIILMYGQTECFRTTYLRHDLYDAKRGAMGFALPGVEVDVVREDGTPCEPNEVGELVHRGALVSLGYWRDEEATAKKFGRGNAQERTLRTGDLVRRDEEGCLFYVGRSELVIKSSGFRFSPREIEDALRTHGDVQDAVAFGVDEPSLGQAVEVAVVARSDSSERETLATRLMAHLRPRLPRYMLPRRVHLIDQIPRNPNGKIRMSELRALSS